MTSTPCLDELVKVLAINEFLDGWTEGRMLHHNHGLLDFGQEDPEAVSEIILVLGRYWMDFSHKKYPEAEGSALRYKGYIFTVLKPYLSKAAKELVSARLSA